MCRAAISGPGRRLRIPTCYRFWMRLRSSQACSDPATRFLRTRGTRWQRWEELRASRISRRPAAMAHSPTQACADEYGNTTAVFSSGTQTWNANTNYCSWGQINILAPSTLPAGETVSLQIYRNGTASNVLQTVVSAAEPSIFIADAGLQLGTVVFAVGSQAGSVVTPDLPAHVGDALSVYYRSEE